MPVTLLRGKMYKIIVQHTRGLYGLHRSFDIRKTRNPGRAAQILTVDEKPRCPFCASNKCLEPVPDIQVSKDGKLIVKIKPRSLYPNLQVAKCKKNDSLFIVEQREKFKGEQRCLYCGCEDIKCKYFASVVKVPVNPGWRYDEVMGVGKGSFDLIKVELGECPHCSRKFQVRKVIDKRESWTEFSNVLSKESFHYLQRGISYMKTHHVLPSDSLKPCNMIVVDITGYRKIGRQFLADDGEVSKPFTKKGRVMSNL